MGCGHRIYFSGKDRRRKNRQAQVKSNIQMNKNMKRLIKLATAVPDARRPWGHLLILSDVLVIAFCSIICGAQTYHALEIFGNAKRMWLSNYLSLPNGIPTADIFERIFETLNPSVVAEKMRWLFQSDEIAGKIIAFDGKTVRGSRREGDPDLHILSAFLTDAQIVPDAIMCDEKSNELTAIDEIASIIAVVW